MANSWVISNELEPFLIVDKPKWLDNFYIEKLDITNKEAVVYTPLGNCGSLLKFRNGCSIHLLKKEWSAEIETYYSEEVIIKMEHCRLLDSWVPDPISVNPEDQRSVLLFARISTDIEVLVDE